MRIERILVLFIMLISLDVYSQENDLLRGLVINNDSVVENVIVKNISTSKYATTNEKGLFFIRVNQEDTLVFSHVSLKDLIVFIEKDHLLLDRSIFEMEEIENQLDEVMLEDYSEINAVSLGIIPKKIEKLSINERRLETAGDFKWYHLLGLLGGSLEIDPILNAINGKTKRLKRNIAIEKKIANIAFLENHYYDYMDHIMKLSDQEIGQLLRFAVEEENLQKLIDDKNEAQIKFFLHGCWIKLKGKR